MTSAGISRGQLYFGGTVLHGTVQPGITVAEVEYSGVKNCSLHTHEHAFFSLLLTGRYAERCARSKLDYRPFRLGYHPPETLHRDEVLAAPARFLIVEVSDSWTALLSLSSVFTPGSPRLCNADGSLLAASLCHRIRCDTNAALTVESAVLEMMGTVVGGLDERIRPRWIPILLDLLHAEFTQKITVVGISRRLGLHPIYLSRQFRRWSGQSVGDFVHQLRMCYALEQLRQPELTLSEIALQLGFADQSQFTKAFRRYQGVTPGNFRKALLSRPVSRAAVSLSKYTVSPPAGLPISARLP